MYDVDVNGWIDLLEMTKLVQSIYQVMGSNYKQGVQLESPEKRAKDIFKRMDKNADGRVTREEFIQTCLIDQKLIEMLTPQTA